MVPPAGGMMQQQQPQAVAGGAPGGMAGAILAKLNAIAAANQLQRFYSPQALQALASRLDSRVNFRDLAARWGQGWGTPTAGVLLWWCCWVFYCNCSRQ